MTPSITYPESPQGSQVDVYHGTRVSDPYRWLEDTDSIATQAWISRQNEVTRTQMEFNERRDGLHARLSKLWNYARAGLPMYRGGRCVRQRNTGLQDQDVVYLSESPHEEGRPLLDPQHFSRDGSVSISSFSLSYDGRYLAYGLNEAGSDWIAFRILDIDTGNEFDEEVRWAKFCTPVWIDATSFVYLSYESSGHASTGTTDTPELRVHRIGTAQSEDAVLFEMPDKPHRIFRPTLSDDKRDVVVHVYEGSGGNNAVYRVSTDDHHIRPLIPRFQARFDFLGNDGPRYYFFTDYEAERGRVVCIDTDDTTAIPNADGRVQAKPAAEDDGIPVLREIVPERTDTLSDALLVGDTLMLLYLYHAQSRLIRRPLGAPSGADRESEVLLPDIGTVSALSGERDGREVYYQYTSFLVPVVNYAYDITTGTSTVLDAARTTFDASHFETRQVFVTSQDGTNVPLFLVHRRGIELDASHPTLLYGYGGFNIPIRPFFSVSRAVWLEQGGVLAVACLRGGGEYGRQWHRNGTRGGKQNVFDDFIACSQWLISNGYTSAGHLAIQGGSNGGLLVGACITQRPDLFAAAHAAVGVLDMLRFHKFTVGWAWTEDFGSPEHAEEFEVLRAYSPLHNIEDGECYPATLLTTGDHDDRVVPGHSFKFAARLQAAQGCDRPVLLRVETRTGHGAGKPTTAIIDEQADILAFLLEHAAG